MIVSCKMLAVKIPWVVHSKRKGLFPKLTNFYPCKAYVVIISHKIFKDHLHQLCVRVSMWPAWYIDSSGSFAFEEQKQLGGE